MTEKEIVEKNADENIIRRTVENFNSAFNRHEVDDVMNLMTENCVFENTSPPRMVCELKVLWQ